MIRGENSCRARQLGCVINYLLAEVRNKVQAPGSGESELHDVKTTVDCSLHGLGGRILGGRAKNSTCTILRMVGEWGEGRERRSQQSTR